VQDKDKTEDKIISGINCNPETARDEMTFTKEFHGKTEGRQYYHVIQSFKPGEVEAEKAHELGKEFASTKFENYECVVCTHTDKDHVHNHIVINSVNKETGKMYHSTKQDLRELKQECNRICERERLSVPEQRKNRYFTMAEIKTAEKGESFKFRLMNDIDEAKKKSSSKEEFIKNMEKQRYGVNWTDSRKYITYTMPEGKKFRDKGLPNEYSKEAMENEFRGIEKEKQQSREQGRETGKPREGDRADGRNIDKDFEFFFRRGQGSNGEHQSKSNDRNGKLHDGKESDAGMERESRSRQENTLGSDKELRRDFEADKDSERGISQQSGKGFRRRTGKTEERASGDRGQFQEVTAGHEGRVREDQGTDKARHEESSATHSKSFNSQYNGSSDPNAHNQLDNKSMADSKVEIEPDVNKEIVERVNMDLDEVLKRTKESVKEKKQDKEQQPKRNISRGRER